MQRSVQTITHSAASGRGGAAGAARRESVDAAMLMLERGGNAVDAAVAAGFVAGVIEPMETTLAGSGFMLVKVPGEAEVHSVEFGPRAPKAARADMFEIDTSRSLDRGLGVSIVVGDENVQGAKAAGVPATLTGLVDAHARFGKLPLVTVLGPAIRAAHDGFGADSYFALESVACLAALRQDPGCARLFLRGNDPFPVAHLGVATLGVAPLVRQAELGLTLEVLATHGAEEVRSGEIGRRLLQTVAERGGILAAEDFAGASTRITTARRLRFRDHEIWAPTAPCGAITQFQILKTWLALYPDGGPAEDTPERLEKLAAASWHAFADRYHWLGDPERVPVPENGLLSDAYAATIARSIHDGDAHPRPRSGEGMPWEVFAGRAVHDPWAFDDGRERGAPWSPDGATEPTSGTTHVSVVDGDGMAVSLTHTAANHFGAKVLCERTGLLLDAAMGWFNARPNAANSIAGGKRPLANMGPFLLTKDGAATAALGAPGGRRIINAVAQVALNLAERRMSAEAALAAPRVDASGAVALVSERLGAVAGQLASDRVPWKAVEEQHQPFNYELARPVLVTRDATGRLEAATDPFSKGFARAC